MKVNKINNCPICNAEANFKINSQRIPTQQSNYYVECVGCGLCTYTYEEKSEAIKIWNIGENLLKPKMKGNKFVLSEFDKK